MTEHDGARWRRFFRERGYERAEPLGRGMEGVVYSLGGGLVGKVWFDRSVEDLRAHERFYRELGSRPLPFAIPAIVETLSARGQAVTVQHEMEGTPLKGALGAGSVSADAAQEATITVLRGLAGTTGGPAARALPVLDEAAPLWQDQESWDSALLSLIDRRVGEYGGHLERSVAGFGAKLGRILESIRGLPVRPTRTVHGDLCPANVLVDGTGRPTAVLDWGFFTTAGDPAFDASVAAGTFDMYGPEARARDEELTCKVVEGLGVALELVLIYRAAYAVATANAYDPDGRDGHFAWCAAQLERSDVVEALFS